MELLQLRYFCSAAESENLSRVAKQYMVPVSNISQSIKRLERELGVELFLHKGNKIEINEDGRRFYEHVSRALSLIGDARESVLDKGKFISGKVRIACGANHGIVSSAIIAFTKDHPAVEFVLTHLDDEGKYDIYVSNTKPKECGECHLLVDDTLSVMMSEEHPLAKWDEVTVSDLEGERFVCNSLGGSMKHVAIELCEAAGFSPNFAVQTYDTAHMRCYVQAGLGISIVPGRWGYEDYEGLVFKTLRGTHRRTYAFTPKRSYTSRAVREFISYLLDAAN